MKVCWIFRSRVRKRYSIENVFSTIKVAIGNGYSIDEYYLPVAHYNKPQYLLENLRYAKRIKGDIYHITGEVHFVSLVLPKDRCVITIHDFVGLDKKYKGIKKWILWLFWYYLPLKRCCKVICISPNTQKELLTRFPFCSDKVTYIPDPLNPHFIRDDKEFNGNKPSILIIGTTPNKNVNRMIEAIHNIKCSVEIIGVLDEKTKNRLDELDIEYNISCNLSEDEVVRKYKESDILLFASEYEGFGLPIIEAQATGRAVVTSGLEPMKSVAGGAACLVDPFDVESIRNGVLRVIENEEYRQKLVEAGFSNAQKYKAEEIARQYEQVYKGVLEK